MNGISKSTFCTKFCVYLNIYNSSHCTERNTYIHISSTHLFGRIPTCRLPRSSIVLECRLFSRGVDIPRNGILFSLFMSRMEKRCKKQLSSFFYVYFPIFFPRKAGERVFLYVQVGMYLAAEATGRLISVPTLVNNQWSSHCFQMIGNIMFSNHVNAKNSFMFVVKVCILQIPNHTIRFRFSIG